MSMIKLFLVAMASVPMASFGLDSETAWVRFRNKADQGIGDDVTFMFFQGEKWCRFQGPVGRGKTGQCNLKASLGFDFTQPEDEDAEQPFVYLWVQKDSAKQDDEIQITEMKIPFVDKTFDYFESIGFDDTCSNRQCDKMSLVSHRIYRIEVFTGCSGCGQRLQYTRVESSKILEDSPNPGYYKNLLEILSTSSKIGSRGSRGMDGTYLTFITGNKECTLESPDDWESCIPEESNQIKSSGFPVGGDENNPFVYFWFHRKRDRSDIDPLGDFGEIDMEGFKLPNRDHIYRKFQADFRNSYECDKDDGECLRLYSDNLYRVKVADSDSEALYFDRVDPCSYVDKTEGLLWAQMKSVCSYGTIDPLDVVEAKVQGNRSDGTHRDTWVTFVYGEKSCIIKNGLGKNNAQASCVMWKNPKTSFDLPTWSNGHRVTWLIVTEDMSNGNDKFAIGKLWIRGMWRTDFDDYGWSNKCEEKDGEDNRAACVMVYGDNAYKFGTVYGGGGFQCVQ